MYVAVKGGEKAILSSHDLLALKRRGDERLPELDVAQIREQLPLAVDRVMAEGSLYDPDLAALAIKQAMGDTQEAIFLLRAYRTTLPRLGYSEPLDTSRMVIQRRISATYKDLPGGQVLGPTFDYTHRLLDFSLSRSAGNESHDSAPTATPNPDTPAERVPRVAEILGDEGLLEDEVGGEDGPVGDITREPLTFPADRDVRLQSLSRADEGFLLGLAYSTQRGFGSTHPFAGEIRMGEAAVELAPEELGFAIEIGDILVTECEMITQFKGTKDIPPQFTRGYGLVFGHSERKAMSMALVDRSLRCEEYGQEPSAPAEDHEFVLYHGDNVEAQGFVSHLKLPHYVDFQGELTMLRSMRKAMDENAATADTQDQDSADTAVQPEEASDHDI